MTMIAGNIERPWRLCDGPRTAAREDFETRPSRTLVPVADRRPRAALDEQEVDCVLE